MKGESKKQKWDERPKKNEGKTKKKERTKESTEWKIKGMKEQWKDQN